MEYIRIVRGLKKTSLNIEKMSSTIIPCSGETIWYGIDEKWNDDGTQLRLGLFKTKVIGYEIKDSKPYPVLLYKPPETCDVDCYLIRESKGNFYPNEKMAGMFGWCAYNNDDLSVFLYMIGKYYEDKYPEPKYKIMYPNIMWKAH